MSHANLVLYGAAIPSYDNDKSTDSSHADLDWGGNLDYSNPDNFTNTKDRQRV
jgi:hypothetical protein